MGEVVAGVVRTDSVVDEFAVTDRFGNGAGGAHTQDTGGSAQCEVNGLLTGPSKV